jgi:CIC family chloride channel protein
MTVGGYATGAAGGIFAPLLLMGGLLGLVYRAALGAVMAPTAPVRAFAIAGMAGLFTGVVRAPLTGVLLLVEMAGAYNLLLPLLVGCLVAKWTADLLHDTPIYEALQKVT